MNKKISDIFEGKDSSLFKSYQEAVMNKVEAQIKETANENELIILIDEHEIAFYVTKDELEPIYEALKEYLKK